MLKLQHANDSFIANLTIDQKDTVIRAGFIWNKILKKWEGNARAAYRLIDHADDVTVQAILDSLNLKFVDTTTVHIKPPEGRSKKPFLHQLQGAQWVLSRRSSYIGYEAGLGKTAIAPLCLNTLPGPAIITCPAFLKYNWEDELEQWLIDFHHIQILHKQSDIINPNADIYIVPDSILHVHDLRQQFFKLNKRFQYLFIDEAHRFKNNDARRTMSLVGRRDVKVKKEKVFWKGFHHIANHIVAMSGTPMPNGRPIELFPLISRHAPHAINYLDQHRYGVQFCAGFESEWGWDYTGASNLDVLHTLLSRNYMLVKKKRDCLDMPEKLPPKFIYIDDDRASALKKDEMTLLSKIRVTDIIQNEIAKSPEFKQRVEDALEDNPEMGGFGFLSELRKMLGLSKVKASVKVIAEIMDDQDKLIVFCWHKEVANLLVEGLSKYKPLKITGDVAHSKRHEIVKQFQTNNHNRILVANIQAAGVGLTLTRANRVVFVEPSYNPADNDQAFDRIDRIGQGEEVQGLFLVVKNSLDHLILNAHITKSENINTAIKPKLGELK
jgi:SWI/SNF-related matrix-associated actin-dependent regulator 1 of chromatin subfamily A